MSLECTLKSLMSDVDRIEWQFRNSDISNFSRFTNIVSQLAPIFKQAEVLKHLMESEDESNYYDYELVRNGHPYILFPTANELNQLKKQVQPFCDRVISLREEFNAFGHEHFTADEAIIPKIVKLEVLIMLLNELSLPEDSLDKLPHEQRIVTDYFKKVAQAKRSSEKETATSSPPVPTTTQHLRH